jgi:hypothetical protein
MTDAAIVDMFPETILKPEDDPNSRFTTRELMAWVKATVSEELDLDHPWEFDLDPFAHPESHWGVEWWTKADNAYVRMLLEKNFVNGPWDECEQVTRWIRDQLPRNFRHQFTAQILPGNRQEQDFWQNLIEPFRDRRSRGGTVVTTHYPPGRASYGFPGNPRGVNQGSMNVNSLLLIWRTR